ncbi:MAG: bifunctional lysylphosphatidylglycerol flippase/synthetase MprF [Anaerolineae bacterium]|nr:bifunctional lysylphosphatidylglycerol flippase/synthetase MprF [Anaerolineae bacterium]
MALAFTSLGVPAARATTITLAFRGLTFWLPLAIGFFLLRRVKSFGAEERSQVGEVWLVRIPALLTGLVGIINVFSAVTPALHDRLLQIRPLVPLEIRHGGHLTAALAGFALLLLARSLWRRKRIAWLLTLVILSLSAASHLVKGFDYEEAILAAALAVWLTVLHPHFHARSDPPSVWQGVRTLVAALVFTLAYGVIGFYLLDRHFSVNFSPAEAARQTIIMFTQFYDPGLEPVTGFGRYFASSIYGVGAMTFGYALLMVFRPVLVRQPAIVAERARAKVIVEAFGCSSLARLTLLGDKSYYFSAGGSLVAYGVEGRIAVALGDPIGPAEDVAATLNGFKAHCARNDWQPAFYQTLSDYLERYRAVGFDTLCIGQEAIVDLSIFSLEGKHNKGLRAAVSRFNKLGYRAEIHQPPLADSLLYELRAVSDEWLAMVKGTEKRFSLGWFDDDYIRHSPVMTVCLPERSISAFANIVPEYRCNEVTIDLMRHRSEVENGIMDFLVVSLFEWAKTQGYATFNLGLSSLAGVGEAADDPVIERGLHYIYEHINRFYNFKGLHAYKAKFHPEWSPRYLVYPGAASLPAVVVALIQADSGNDFPWGYLKR